MKYFTAKIDGKDEILGSAGATKRYLKAHPEIESVVRWWWSGSDLIDAEDFTRDEILGQTVKQSETGATAQWAHDHGCLSVNAGQARSDSRQQNEKGN